ncbi:MAG: hypothetical protein KKB02_03705 [Alphaproteobacteria bacterium]|nr:hypothetical protein [Alphaproteobacteria bacterium]
MLTRADFLGDWRLSRQIDDRLAGCKGVFEGTARITGVGARDATYAEAGLLRFGDAAPLRAERRYLWTFAPHRIAITFVDGRDFVAFRPLGRAAEAVHLCGADTYRVIYDLTDWPCWQAIWTVTGPRKDYGLRSVYHRA